MTVSAEYAAKHLAELFDAADRGEEVEIARAEKQAVKLVLGMSGKAAKRTGQRVLGAGRGEIRVPSDEEWAEMDTELERLMNKAPLMSSGEI